MKLLIIEDDGNILSLLKRGFIEENNSVESAIDSEEGIYMATMGSYDVIILDWMLPQKNGIEVLQTLREQNNTTPVIMLTAKDEIKDKVLGLRKGADDYLSKPFSFEELLARVEALHRRNISQGSNTITIKDIMIDLESKIITKDGGEITLTAKEYELLLFLIKHKNAIVSNAMIEEQLWNNETYINSNVIQVTIYHLRQKIGKTFIISLRGRGYKIEI